MYICIYISTAPMKCIWFSFSLVLYKPFENGSILKINIGNTNQFHRNKLQNIGFLF